MIQLESRALLGYPVLLLLAFVAAARLCGLCVWGVLPSVPWNVEPREVVVGSPVVLRETVEARKDSRGSKPEPRPRPPEKKTQKVDQVQSTRPAQQLHDPKTAKEEEANRSQEAVRVGELPARHHQATTALLPGSVPGRTESSSGSSPIEPGLLGERQPGPVGQGSEIATGPLPAPSPPGGGTGEGGLDPGAMPGRHTDGSGGAGDRAVVDAGEIQERSVGTGDGGDSGGGALQAGSLGEMVPAKDLRGIILEEYSGTGLKAFLRQLEAQVRHRYAADYDQGKHKSLKHAADIQAVVLNGAGPRTLRAVWGNGFAMDVLFAEGAILSGVTKERAGEWNNDLRPTTINEQEQMKCIAAFFSAR